MRLHFGPFGSESPARARFSHRAIQSGSRRDAQSCAVSATSCLLAAHTVNQTDSRVSGGFAPGLRPRRFFFSN